MSESTVTIQEPQVHVIPAENFDGFVKAFAKIVKRGEKLGVPVPTYQVVETRLVDADEAGLTQRKVLFVTVRGEGPKFDGWVPRAVIDLDPDDAPGGPHVVHVIGDGEGDPGWRSETDRCDHCTQTPRGRLKLVVVEHDDGTRKVVGTTCVQDFLGGVAPERIARWFELIASLDDLADSYEEDGMAGGGRIELRYRPADFLALVVAAIALDGWVSRGDARNGINRVATADQVAGIIEDFTSKYAKNRAAARAYLPSDAQKAEADAALEWARDLDDVDWSDYLANVQAVANKAGWRSKDIGLGASIAVAYARHLEKEVAKAKEADDLSGSVWVGAVGDKITFEADVLAVRPYSGDYGEIDIIRMLTTDGNVIVWWSSAGVSFPVYSDDEKTIVAGSRGIEPGDHVFGKGTVKRHGEFNGANETTVTRAKLSLEPLPAVKARKAKKAVA